MVLKCRVYDVNSMVQLAYKSTEECRSRPERKPGAWGAYQYPSDCQKRGGTAENAMIPAPFQFE